MIYTVSFNPSLDYVQDLDCVNLGYVNRTSGEKILPGGKGINVSMVLKNLGFENQALGFTPDLPERFCNPCCRQKVWKAILLS